MFQRMGAGDMPARVAMLPSLSRMNCRPGASAASLMVRIVSSTGW
jgi:hypothetical protein